MATPSVTTQRPRVCFSFAAYAKNVIDGLKSADIPVGPGLSDEEFSALESIFNLKFPLDLRAFLRVGLPTGPGFTNWRSSSAQQLQILINLPSLGLLKEVSKGRFWARSWPNKPYIGPEAIALAKKMLKKVPVLLPVYRNCYIPCGENAAGSPIFFINGGEIRVLSFDLTGFFHGADFREREWAVDRRRESLGGLFRLPRWAAEEAREVEFWTEVAAARGRRTAARGGWWREGGEEVMEGVWGKLRDGGWREEEVREMMMIEMDGGDGFWGSKEEVEGNVRGLSERLLRAGWSKEDVAESLGCQVSEVVETPVCSSSSSSYWCDFQLTPSRFLEVV